MMHCEQRKSAFSLIELAMSVIIVGIILSIIMSAKSVIEQSKIKAVIADFAYYQTAFNNFQKIYNAYPGDMSNASSYWTSTCATTITCNGNGNNVINFVVSSNTSEVTRLWKHLDLADLITQSFQIIPAAYNGGLEINLSAPRSQIKKAGYMIVGGTQIGGTAGTPVNSIFNSTQNAIYIGIWSENSARTMDIGALSAADAYLIDEKLDDAIISSGNAIGNSTGIIRTIAGFGSTTNNCINASGYYNVTESSVQSCVMGYSLND